MSAITEPVYVVKKGALVVDRRPIRKRTSVAVDADEVKFMIFANSSPSRPGSRFLTSAIASDKNVVALQAVPARVSVIADLLGKPYRAVKDVVIGLVDRGEIPKDVVALI